MAHYTLEEFKTNAAAGNAIQLTNAVGRTDVVLQIGGVSIQLTQALQSVSLVNGVKTTTIEDKSILDLGTRFSAKQVLDSVSLRQAISAGVVFADPGTAALSLEPHTV